MFDARRQDDSGFLVNLATRAGNLAILSIAGGCYDVARSLLNFQRLAVAGMKVHPSLVPVVESELDAVYDAVQFAAQHRMGWRRN